VLTGYDVVLGPAAARASGYFTFVPLVSELHAGLASHPIALFDPRRFA
jgi:hypothetical protein